MSLAGMIVTDEEAMICDFAETYHVYDYRALPARTAAVLGAGLRDDSRIKMKMAGTDVPVDTLLLVGIFDRLNHLIWMQTKNGHDGVNHPSELMDVFIRKDKDELVSFDSGDDFDDARTALLRNIEKEELTNG